MDKKSMKKMDDAELSGVSGGYIHNNGAGPGENQWEIIDKQGNVVQTVYYKTDAKLISRNYGWTDKEITDEQLKRLRETSKLD